MHKCNEASHLLYLPVMCSSLLSAALSQVGTERKEGGNEQKLNERRGADSTFILPFYDLLNVLERF